MCCSTRSLQAVGVGSDTALDWLWRRNSGATGGLGAVPARTSSETRPPKTPRECLREGAGDSVFIRVIIFFVCFGLSLVTGRDSRECWTVHQFLASSVP